MSHIPIVSGIYRTFHDLNPGESFLEYEGSTITIPLRVRLPGGDWKEERLKLAAFMRLEVYPAYVNGLGTREFQFTIRDWELFGYSPLLNELFMGDPRGQLGKGADASEGRETAVLTFTVAHHYEKHGDDEDQILAPVNHLRIDDIVSHDYMDGNVYWQMDEDPSEKGKLRVCFHKKALDEKGQVSRLSLEEDYDDLLGIASGLTPGEEFRAFRKVDRNTVRAAGNTLLAPGQRPRNASSFHWRLGKSPRPAVGRLHIVSPPRSFCVAHQGPAPGYQADSCDFPARITYAASYHIYINDTRFVEDQAGVAVADGIDQIPPRDVRVAFEKPHAGIILGKYLAFDAGTCTGMRTITEWVYRQGVELARYWRSARLDTQSGSPPPTPPLFD